MEQYLVSEIVDNALERTTDAGLARVGVSPIDEGRFEWSRRQSQRYCREVDLRVVHSCRRKWWIWGRWTRLALDCGGGEEEGSDDNTMVAEGGHLLGRRYLEFDINECYKGWRNDIIGHHLAPLFGRST